MLPINRIQQRDWTLINLDSIAAINPRRPRIEIEDNKLVSFVPMAAVDDELGKIITLEEKKYKEVRHGYTYFEENDVLFAKITPSMENGKAAIAKGLINGFGYGTTEFHVIRCGTSVIPEWVYYFIRQEIFRKEAKKAFRGTVGQQRVPAEFIASHPIPIPYPNDTEKSLEEQRHIVARIESLFTEVEQAKKLHASIVKDTEQLLDAVLDDVFSKDNINIKMATVRLSNIANDTTRRNPKNEFPDKKFYYVDISSVDKEKCKIVSPKEILGSDAPSRARKVIHKGDVLFSTTRPGLKTIALIPEDLDNQICSTGFCVLRHKEHVLPEYVFYQLRSPFFIKQIIKKQHGASYPAVTDSEIFDSEMLFPEGNEMDSVLIQKEIVEKCKQIDQYIDSLSNSQKEIKNELNDLQQSILFRAFRGEL